MNEIICLGKGLIKLILWPIVLLIWVPLGIMDMFVELGGGYVGNGGKLMYWFIDL
jgi:hypothetical protein